VSEDRLVNVLATMIQRTLDKSGDVFEEGGNYYLWWLAREMEIEEAVDNELYFRDGDNE